MLHVSYSNQVEELVSALIEHVEHFESIYPTHFLDEVPVIVPNWNLETFIKFKVAERRGIAARFRFGKIEDFLGNLIPEDMRSEYKLLTQDIMQALLLDVLSDDAFLAASELAPVREYLYAKGNHTDVVDLRRFQLADELKRCFREYELSRAQMLRDWPEKRVVEREPFRAVEHWQRVIWLRLFGEGGLVDAIHHETGVQHLTLLQVFDRVPVDMLNIPQHAHIFGLSYMAQAFKDVFARFSSAENHHICIYALNPCAAYWEDIYFGPDNNEDDIIPQSSESELFVVEDDTPALKLWSRAGRDNHRMLNQLAGHNAREFFKSPLADGTETTTLKQLQEDIFNRHPRREDVSDTDSTEDQHDDSIVFLACPTIQREVEVISNEIWKLMLAHGEDSAQESESSQHAQKLMFSDIAVIIPPHQREAYQSQIHAVFNDNHAIPFNIVDITGKSSSRILEAVELLLSLPFSEFQRRDLLKLMTHPNVMENFSEIDPEQWIKWVEELHILHGADHDDHENTYIKSDIFNWDQGVRRLVLGAFMTDRKTGDERIYSVGEHSYLPLSYGHTEMESATTIAMLARSLIHDARFLKGARMPRKKWANVLRELLNTYISATEDFDARDLMQCYKILGDLAASDITGHDVSYRIVFEYLLQNLDALESKFGQYLADGVAVSSFLPMRPIPFKYVFIVGMGEGKFPSPDAYNPLDLRLAKRVEGDVRTRDQDKYMFLETLISTRDGLYLSWVSRDSSTGEPLEPSSVIKELQYMLRGYDSPEALKNRTRIHPLRRYAPDYFADTQELRDGYVKYTKYPNYLKDAHAEYRLARLRDDLFEYCATHHVKFPSLAQLKQCLSDEEWGSLSDLLRCFPAPEQDLPEESAELSVTQPEEVRHITLSFNQIRKFLECPLQASATLILGLYDDDNNDAFEEDRELFSTSRMHASVLLREVFSRALEFTTTHPDPENLAALYDERARLFELQGLSPTGLFHESEYNTHLNVLKTWHNNLSLFGLKPQETSLKPRRFGRAHEGLVNERVDDPIVLEFELKQQSAVPPQRIKVEIHGETQLTDADCSTALILKNSEHAPSIKDFLRGYLDHVFVAASGQNRESTQYRIVVNPAKSLTSVDANRRDKEIDKYTREFSALPTDQAREYLQNVVSEMITQMHDYLMPIEAVDKYFKAQKQENPKSFEQILDDILAQPDRGYSSLYGPIRNPERYPPPSDPLKLISKRLQTFFERCQQD